MDILSSTTPSTSPPPSPLQYPFIFPRRVISQILSYLLIPNLSTNLTTFSFPSFIDCLSFASAFPKYANEVREQCLPCIDTIDFLYPLLPHSNKHLVHQLSPTFSNVIPTLPLIFRFNLRHVALPPTLDSKILSSFVTSIVTHAPNLRSFSFTDGELVDEVIAFNIGTFPNLSVLQVIDPRITFISFMQSFSLFPKLKRLSLQNVNSSVLSCVTQMLNARSRNNFKLEELSILFNNNNNNMNECNCIQTMYDDQVDQFMDYLKIYAISDLGSLQHLHVAVNCPTQSQEFQKISCNLTLERLVAKLTPSFPLSTALNLSIVPIMSTTTERERIYHGQQLPVTFPYTWYLDDDVERYISKMNIFSSFSSSSSSSLACKNSENLSLGNSCNNQADNVMEDTKTKSNTTAFVQKGFLTNTMKAKDALENCDTLSIFHIGYVANKLRANPSLQHDMQSALRSAKRINRLNLFQCTLANDDKLSDWYDKDYDMNDQQENNSKSFLTNQLSAVTPIDKFQTLCNHLGYIRTIHTIQLGPSFFIHAPPLSHDHDQIYVFTEFLQTFPRLITLYLTRIQETLTCEQCLTLLNKLILFLNVIRSVYRNNQLDTFNNFRFLHMDVDYFKREGLKKGDSELFYIYEFKNSLEQIEKELESLRLEQPQLLIDSVVENVECFKFDLEQLEKE